jgi:adenosylmethionine---8-amino-7-oxononanoate aminotransferase
MTGTIITGTDTGVGKTLASAVFLRALARRSPPVPARYWKPVQTGWPADDDTEVVVRLAALSPASAAPPAVHLRLPASPYEAALAEGAAVPDPLPRPADFEASGPWIVEGAGGLLVPLSERVLFADLFEDLGLPLVLVARPDVGTLNHTLLSLSECDRRGFEVLAVVVSGPPTDAVLAALRTHGVRRDVLVLPRLPAVDVAAVDAAAAGIVADAGWRRLFDRVASDGARGDLPRGTLLRRDAEVSWHPYTQHGLAVPPLAVAAAQGAWLVLEDGRRVLDGISSWWTGLHGHGHPAIALAIARQARRLDHVQFAGATHEPAVALAERLLGIAPPGLERVFYSDDGSTAVETALKMAAAFQARRGAGRRTRFLALEGGYHGDTAGAMSVSEDGPFTRDYRALRFDPVRIPVPHGNRSVDACRAALADAVEREGDVFAALIAEPLLMGAAGMRVTTPSFLRMLREETSARGMLLIADEVFTGFGRTGAMFACERAGISPDLLCVGKALTGGTLTLAATLATGSVWSAFLSEDRAAAFLHGHSYTANPIACAAALASLHLLDARALDRASEIGERLEQGLAPLRGRRGVREIRGIGLVHAVELDDPDGRGYLSGVSRRLAEAALERGVLLRPLGPVLYALPPLCTADAEVDLVAEAMVHAVRAAIPDPIGVGSPRPDAGTP